MRAEVSACILFLLSFSASSDTFSPPLNRFNRLHSRRPRYPLLILSFCSPFAVLILSLSTPSHPLISSPHPPLLFLTICFSFSHPSLLILLSSPYHLPIFPLSSPHFSSPLPYPHHILSLSPPYPHLILIILFSYPSSYPLLISSPHPHLLLILPSSYLFSPSPLFIPPRILTISSPRCWLRRV